MSDGYKTAAEHEKCATNWRQLESLSPVPSTRRRAREMAQEHERCAREIRKMKAALALRENPND
jgi:hypothetical protein